MRIGTEVVLWAGFHPYLCRENGNLAGGAVRIGTEVVLWAGFHPYRAGKAEKLIIYAVLRHIRCKHICALAPEYDELWDG